MKAKKNKENSGITDIQNCREINYSTKPCPFKRSKGNVAYGKNLINFSVINVYYSHTLVIECIMYILNSYSCTLCTRYLVTLPNYFFMYFL